MWAAVAVIMFTMALTGHKHAISNEIPTGETQVEPNHPHAHQPVEQNLHKVQSARVPPVVHPLPGLPHLWQEINQTTYMPGVMVTFTSATARAMFSNATITSGNNHQVSLLLTAHSNNATVATTAIRISTSNGQLPGLLHPHHALQHVLQEAVAEWVVEEGDKRIICAAGFH